MTSRVFVVGCSRSGTTILMNVLARQFRLDVFEETEFMLPWIDARPHYRHRYRMARTARCVYRAIRAVHTDEFSELRDGNAKLKRLLKRLSGDLGYPGSIASVISRQLAFEYITAKFDARACHGGYMGWVEKTARHFLSIDLARQHVPGARIVHIVRPGRDVVASLIDRARSKSARHGRENDIDWACDVWLNAANVAVQRRNDTDYYVLNYEDLVADPQRAVQALECFVGLRHGEKDGDVLAGCDVRAPARKYEAMFTDDEKRRIERRLEAESPFRNVRNASRLDAWPF